MFTLSYSTLIIGFVVLLLVNLILSAASYMAKYSIKRGLTPDSDDNTREGANVVIDNINHNVTTGRRLINIFGILVILVMFVIDPFSRFGKQVDVGSEHTLEVVRQTKITPPEVIKQTNDVAENRTRVKIAEKIKKDKAENMAEFKDFLSNN